MEKIGKASWLVVWNLVVMPIGCALDLLRMPQWLQEYRENGEPRPMAKGCKEILDEYVDSWKNVGRALKE